MSLLVEYLLYPVVKAYTHEHEITNETSNDKSAQRQKRRQFIRTATSDGRNVDES